VCVISSFLVATSRTSPISTLVTFDSFTFTTPRTRFRFTTRQVLRLLDRNSSTSTYFYARDVAIPPRLVDTVPRRFSSTSPKLSRVRSSDSPTMAKDSRWQENSRRRLPTSSEKSSSQSPRVEEFGSEFGRVDSILELFRSVWCFDFMEFEWRN